MASPSSPPAAPAADAKTPFRPFRLAADRDKAIFGLKVSKVRDPPVLLLLFHLLRP